MRTLTQKYHRFLIVLISLIWLSHFLQVLTPETGYDAVWYHLPIAEKIVENKKLTYIPEIYQTINPQLSDLMFLPGFLLFGEAGAKLTAYVFGTALTMATYHLAKKFINKDLALLSAVFVSTFQVVAWQAASFYIDVAKAFWEILSILFIILALENKNERFLKYLFYSAILLGISLASKTFSILFLPIFGIFWWIILLYKKNQKPILYLLILLLVTIVIPAPFYLMSLKHTGHLFYSAADPFQTLILENGDLTLLGYLIRKFLTLPLSLWQFSIARDYVSPILIPLMGISIYYLLKSQNWKALLNSKNTRIKISFLVIFSLWQWLIWWLIPPLSTRYALSGFITLAILLIWLVSKIRDENIKKSFISVILIISLLQMIPRAIVNIRSLRYVTGQQTKDQYLEQFRDGWIDEPLDKWHYRQK